MVYDPALLLKIDAWRKKQPRIATWSDAVRVLLKMALGMK